MLNQHTRFIMYITTIMMTVISVPRDRPKRAIADAKGQYMKFFILFTFLLILPLTSHAQTPVTNQQANTYFTQCVTNSAATEKRFSPESQKLFCACTAARLTQYFSMEDMQTMTDPKNPNQRAALNKMIVNIYAPCMDEPTRDYHYSQCVANPQVARLGQNPETLCRCAADQVADYMKVHAAEQFQIILDHNPNIEDPMQALYDDPKFQSMTQSKLLGCLK